MKTTPTAIPQLVDSQVEHIRSSGGLTSTQVQHILDGIKGLSTIEELEKIPDDLFESIRRSGFLTSSQVSHVFDGIRAAASKPYSFELTLSGTVHLMAPSQAAAEHLLKRKLISAPCNLGTWFNGAPITAECTLVGDPAVTAIDEKDVPSKGAPLDQLIVAVAVMLRAIDGEANFKSKHSTLIQQLRDGHKAVDVTLE